MSADDSICESSLPPNKSSGDIGELKPCPFCGGADLTLTVNRHGWKIVECDNCGMRGPCIDLEGDEYLHRWNTRTPDPESAAEIERLRREVWLLRNDLANANDNYHEVSTRLESAVAAAWEEAAKIAETTPMGMENHPQKIASAIRSKSQQK